MSGKLSNGCASHRVGLCSSLPRAFIPTLRGSIRRCSLVANCKPNDLVASPSSSVAIVEASVDSDACLPIITSTLDVLEQQEETLLVVSEIAEQANEKYKWLAFWLSSAVVFGAGIGIMEGGTKCQEFFAGYLLEQSLSVDNLFVFVLVFRYFKTPLDGQEKVLTYGIATAAVLRGVLIAAGIEIVEEWRPVLAVFAAILVASSYKLLTASNEDDNEDLADNDVVKICRRFIKCTDTYDGNNFFTTLADGTRAATPLLLTLAVVELSDVVFAVDSIPAVFGVTLDPFIVYTSNMFAIMSLRAVYTFAATFMTKLQYIDKAVALVLGFVGVKMLLDLGDVHIPTDVSLALVAVVLTAGTAASLLLPAEAAVEKD